MTERNPIPFPTNPPPPPRGTPDEGDLLAFVEGEALARDRQTALARALAADPVLARRLEMIRADRAALRAMPEEPVPPALLDGVEAALERRLLLGMERDGRPLDGRPPMTIVRPARRSVFEAFVSDRTGRRLALAAAMLVVVGGVSYLGVTMLSTTPSAGTGGLIAVAPKTETSVEATEALSEIATSAGVATPGTNEGVTLAAGPAFDSGSSAPDLATIPGTLAGAPIEPVGIDAARAVELAREHRLAIRITATDGARAAARVESLAERLRRPSAAWAPWRVCREVPTELAEALRPRSAPTPPAIWTAAPELPAVASEDGRTAEPVALGAMSPPPETPIPETPSHVYAVEVRLDQAAFESVLASLSSGGGQRAWFVEVSRPFPASERPPLTAPAMLWWGQSPSQWASWTTVPVVVGSSR